MYAMLTGKLPYPGEDIPKLYPLMMNDQFPMPPKLSAGCKDLLAQLLKGELPPTNPLIIFVRSACEDPRLLPDIGH